MALAISALRARRASRQGGGAGEPKTAPSGSKAGPSAPASLGEVKAALDNILSEYLLSNDSAEVTRRVHALARHASTSVSLLLVKSVIAKALDRGDRDRELLACLLSSLEVRGTITHLHIERGFRDMIARLPELQLDQPRAVPVLASMLVYLVIDDAVAEGFLDTSGHSSDSSEGDAAAAHLATVSEAALSLIHSRTPTPLVQMRAMYRELVAKYLAGGPLSALEEDVALIHARHTLPELVRKLVQLCVDDASPFVRETGSDLLAALHARKVLTTAMIEEGFLRVLRSAADLTLDNPQAPLVIAQFLARAIGDGVVPLGFLATIPAHLLGVPAVAVLPAEVPPALRPTPAPWGSADGATLGVPAQAPASCPPGGGDDDLGIVLSEAEEEAGSGAPAVAPVTNTLARSKLAERGDDGTWVSVDGASLTATPLAPLASPGSGARAGAAGGAPLLSSSSSSSFLAPSSLSSSSSVSLGVMVPSPSGAGSGLPLPPPPAAVPLLRTPSLQDYMPAPAAVRTYVRVADTARTVLGLTKALLGPAAAGTDGSASSPPSPIVMPDAGPDADAGLDDFSLEFQIPRLKRVWGYSGARPVQELRREVLDCASDFAADVAAVAAGPSRPRSQRAAAPAPQANTAVNLEETRSRLVEEAARRVRSLGCPPLLHQVVRALVSEAAAAAASSPDVCAAVGQLLVLVLEQGTISQDDLTAGFKAAFAVLEEADDAVAAAAMPAVAAVLRHLSSRGALRPNFFAEANPATGPASSGDDTPLITKVSRLVAAAAP